MELQDVFCLSLDELRTIVDHHISQHKQFKSVVSCAKKDEIGIVEFGIGIYPTWQEGNIVQKQGAVVLATDYFTEIDYPVMPLKTKILVYIAEPDQYVSCHDFIDNDVKYFYAEQHFAAETAYLGSKEREPFVHWTPFNMEPLPAPNLLYTSRTGENEWMTLKCVVDTKSKAPPKCINYYIFYINPQTLGK